MNGAKYREKLEEHLLRGHKMLVSVAEQPLLAAQQPSIINIQVEMVEGFTSQTSSVGLFEFLC